MHVRAPCRRPLAATAPRALLAIPPNTCARGAPRIAAARHGALDCALCGADMKAGQINAVYSDEGYGFVTGEDHMAPPSAAVQAGASLATVLRLLTTMPGSKVRRLHGGHRVARRRRGAAAPHAQLTAAQLQAKVLPVAKEVLKVTRQKGPSWETAREPHEVTFSAASGAVRPDLDAAAQPDTWRQRTCALGGGALPRGVELALCSMAEGERATFVMPRRLLRGAHDASWAGGADATDGGQWQLDVELASFVEVRDMTGEGKARSCCSVVCASQRRPGTPRPCARRELGVAQSGMSSRW